MVTAAKCGEEPQKEKFPAKLSNFRITNKTISKRNSKPTVPLHRRLVPHTYCYYYYYPNILGIKGWYWPQGLLSMPTDNSHKSWETPSDKKSVSSASKSDFLTSSIVIPGQCSCSREERMKTDPRRLKTETFD